MPESMKAAVYTRYKVMAYNESTPDFSVIRDSAMVEVFASTEEEAIKKAKKLINKKDYRVSEVSEYFYDKRIEGNSGKDE